MNGDSASSLDHGAHLLDDGHFGKPGRELPDVVLGRGRPQLRHQLPGRERYVEPAALVITASSASITYGGAAPDHHGLVLGVRER